MAGLNMAQIDGDELAGYHQPGLNAGIKAAALLSDNWRLNLELLFSQQGADRSVKDPFRSIYDNIRLNVLEVPVGISYAAWKLQPIAGLSYNRLISHRIRDIGGVDVSRNFTLDSNGLSSFFGAAYFFSPQWGVDARYTRAMTINKARSALAGGQVDRFRSYFLSLRLVWMFN